MFRMLPPENSTLSNGDLSDFKQNIQEIALKRLDGADDNLKEGASSLETGIEVIRAVEVLSNLQVVDDTSNYKEKDHNTIGEHKKHLPDSSTDTKKNSTESSENKKNDETCNNGYEDSISKNESAAVQLNDHKSINNDAIKKENDNDVLKMTRKKNKNRKKTKKLLQETKLDQDKEKNKEISAKIYKKSPNKSLKVKRIHLRSPKQLEVPLSTNYSLKLPIPQTFQETTRLSPDPLLEVCKSSQQPYDTITLGNKDAKRLIDELKNGIDPNLRTQRVIKQSFLSPENDQMDKRKQDSLFSFSRLGYSNSNSSFVLHWQNILTLSLKLFPDVRQLHRAIHKVKSVDIRITEDEAYCALADCNGSVDEAIGKICDPMYHEDLCNICSIIDVNSYTRMLPEKISDIECEPGFYMPSFSPIRLKKMEPISLIHEDISLDNNKIPEINRSGKLIFRKKNTFSFVQATQEPLTKIPTRSIQESGFTFDLRNNRAKAYNLNTINGCIESSLQKKKERNITEIFFETDSWGVKSRHGKSTPLGTSNRLFSPLQMTQDTFTDAKRYDR